MAYPVNGHSIATVVSLPVIHSALSLQLTPPARSSYSPPFRGIKVLLDHLSRWHLQQSYTICQCWYGNPGPLSTHGYDPGICNQPPRCTCCCFPRILPILPSQAFFPQNSSGIDYSPKAHSPPRFPPSHLCAKEWLWTLSL